MENFCNNTEIPVGAKVKIIKNNFGNECEPFVGCTGTAVNPFNTGCKKPDWVGVIIEQYTIYGNKFNFHKDELILL
jgi:hypothetical protein